MSPKHILEMEQDLSPKFWMDFNTMEQLAIKSNIEELLEKLLKTRSREDSYVQKLKRWRVQEQPF